MTLQISEQKILDFNNDFTNIQTENLQFLKKILDFNNDFTNK